MNKVFYRLKTAMVSKDRIVVFSTPFYYSEKNQSVPYGPKKLNRALPAPPGKGGGRSKNILTPTSPTNNF